jgi:hypothetical protein
MALSPRDERYGWVALILYALGAFVIAVALVFGVRWIYRSIHHSNQTTAPQPVSVSQPTKKSKSSSSSNSSHQSQSDSDSNGSQSLPDNGPGDVAALFVGTSAVAAGLHYFVRTRRFSS